MNEWSAKAMFVLIHATNCLFKQNKDIQQPVKIG